MNIMGEIAKLVEKMGGSMGEDVSTLKDPEEISAYEKAKSVEGTDAKMSGWCPGCRVWHTGTVIAVMIKGGASLTMLGDDDGLHGVFSTSLRSKEEHEQTLSDMMNLSKEEAQDLGTKINPVLFELIRSNLPRVERVETFDVRQAHRDAVQRNSFLAAIDNDGDAVVLSLIPDLSVVVHEFIKLNAIRIVDAKGIAELQPLARPPKWGDDV